MGAAGPWKRTRKLGPDRHEAARRRRKPGRATAVSKDIHEDRGRRQTKLASRKGG